MQVFRCSFRAGCGGHFDVNTMQGADFTTARAFGAGAGTVAPDGATVVAMQATTQSYATRVGEHEYVVSLRCSLISLMMLVLTCPALWP